MLRRSLFVFLFAAALLAMALPSLTVLRAQSTQLPRAGRSFTFGIIEGPDNLLGDSAQSQTTLTLTVVSPYQGCGIILSPSGYEMDFSFAPGSPTVITLPYDLMLLYDLGKSDKGIIVKTTEPVNLVLHDFVLDAGDATQILPDEALDTNYVAFGWGIWDDPEDDEHNNTEILVTAVDDSTQVTIISSVNTRSGQLAGVPFTTTLDHGECYIIKADTSDHSADPSLSGTQIHSTKPVSVICGLTCAYVPLEVESCNEFLDEIIGKKWWGSHFFVSPLGNADSTVEVVLTSDRQFFALINKGFVGSTNNRIVAVLGGAGEIHTINSQSEPVAVEANQITRGSGNSFYGITDPTLVTLLDTAYYSDTLIWNTPFYDWNNQFVQFVDGFQNWVPLIFPTIDYGSITLDGRPLSSAGAAPNVINGSRYSDIVPSLNPGVHTIISPDPVFGLGTGFALADAYSFIAGGIAGLVPLDTVRHNLILQADSATSCSDFEVAASLATPILVSEGDIVLTISIDYDPSTLRLVTIEPGDVLANGRFTVDSSTAGTVVIVTHGKPYITGSDLFQMVFEGLTPVSATTVGKNSTVTACGDYNETIIIQPVTFSIRANYDSSHTRLAISISPVSLGDQASADVTISGLPQNADVKQFDLFLTYNHDVLTYEQADLNGTLTDIWPQPTVSRGETTDTLQFNSIDALASSAGPMVLAHLLFETFVADSSYSPIFISSSLPGVETGCPTTFLSPPASTLFLGKDLCGDTLFREFMLGKMLSLDRAEINSDGNLHVILQAPVAEVVELTLADMLGRTVWSGEMSCSNGSNERELPLPPEIPSGALTLRVSSGGTVISRKLVIVK